MGDSKFTTKLGTIYTIYQNSIKSTHWVASECELFRFFEMSTREMFF